MDCAYSLGMGSTWNPPHHTPCHTSTGMHASSITAAHQNSKMSANAAAILHCDVAECTDSLISIGGSRYDPHKNKNTLFRKNLCIAWYTVAAMLVIWDDPKSWAHLATLPFPKPEGFRRRPKDMLDAYDLIPILWHTPVQVGHVPHLPHP